MIDFIYASDVRVKVRLEGKLVGYIVRSNKGWRYIARGWKFVGDPFPTLRDCQKSLMPELQEVANG